MNTILKLATASVAALALAVPLTHAQETEGDQIERPGGGMKPDMMEGHGMMDHGSVARGRRTRRGRQLPRPELPRQRNRVRRRAPRRRQRPS